MTDPLKVLLVGAGRFGKHYIRILKTLQTQREVLFAGVCVQTASSASQIATEYGITTYSHLTDELIMSVDAVIIATPPETHAALVARCLPKVHVFVEKPVSMSAEEASLLEPVVTASKNVLMVGHILRYHPVTHELMTLLRAESLPPHIIGEFINPLNTDQGRDPSLELLHLYDVLDAIWPELEVADVARRDVGRLAKMTMRFKGGSVTRLELGWFKDIKTRKLAFLYAHRRIEADYASSTITVTDASGQVTSAHAPTRELLQLEVEDFLKACNGSHNPVPFAVGKKIVEWADRVSDRLQSALPRDRKPRVAIIGAGMFGCTTAIALASDHDVTLFERNPTILSEGAWANNFRHHAGYHYPRSDETVRDVQNATASFEARYGAAIVRNVPNYYGIARENSHVDLAAFVAFCEKHGLTHKVVTETIFPSATVAATVLVDEPSYHYGSLSDVVKEELQASSVAVRVGAHVCGVVISEHGTKQLTINSGSVHTVEEFDIVINATYAAINWFTQALGVPFVPVRVDWAEVPIIHLEIPPISLTVIDGPFACMLPTGNPYEFTVYHVIESVLERYTPGDGRIRDVKSRTTNALAILNHSLPYLPFLKGAVLKESRQVYRAVQANREYDDNRVAEIYDHGFDCFSILSGKIVSCVALSQRLADMVRHHRSD